MRGLTPLSTLLLIGVEVLNIAVQHLLTDVDEWVGWLSIGVTLSIVFAIGWLLGRAGHGYWRAMLFATGFWYLSSAISVAAMALTGDGELEAFWGYVIATTLFLPLALVVAALAMTAAKRLRFT